MTKPRYSLAYAEFLLSSFVKRRGWRRASYWLSEDAAQVTGELPGHHPRRTAARALLKGAEVGVDLGGWIPRSASGVRSRLLEHPTEWVTLEGLLVLVTREEPAS